MTPVSSPPETELCSKQWCPQTPPDVWQGWATFPSVQANGTVANAEPCDGRLRPGSQLPGCLTLDRLFLP